MAAARAHREGGRGKYGPFRPHACVGWDGMQARTNNWPPSYLGWRSLLKTGAASGLSKLRAGYIGHSAGACWPSAGCGLSRLAFSSTTTTSACALLLPLLLQLGCRAHCGRAAANRPAHLEELRVLCKVPVAYELLSLLVVLRYHEAAEDGADVADLRMHALVFAAPRQDVHLQVVFTPRGAGRAHAMTMPLAIAGGLGPKDAKARWSGAVKAAATRMQCSTSGC